MAQNVQNVTLALTLPITCHICLGKVRQPVICANHHVFCSSCIELWLKNNSQCPACRVPITPENPCRDIIGGTGENECIPSHSVRKHLRKTRLELLHKEYEDEIEIHLKEIEELKKANSNLEEKLNEHVCALPSAQEIGQLDKSSAGARTLEELSKKLQAASDTIGKVTSDFEKLKEENRRLRNENFEFGRENLRLKVEVESRSPQKFGRFTVAALQAKVDQYEREMNRLRKALERSDQYIEELEGQIEQLKQASEEKENGRSNCDGSLLTGGNMHSKGTGTALNWQEVKLAEVSLDLVQRSHEEVDPGDTRGSPTTSNDYEPTSAQGTYVAKGRFSANLPDQTKLNQDNVIWKRPLQKPSGGKNEADTPSKEENVPDCSSPSTSLGQFSSLQLNTPDGKVASTQTSIKKPLTYLRKLVFDDFRKKTAPAGINQSGSHIEESLIKDQYGTTHFKESNSELSCPNYDSQEGPHIYHQELKLWEPVTSQPSQCLLKKYPNISGIHHSRLRSDNPMAATFVDSIMPDLEMCKSTMHANKTYQASSTEDSTEFHHNYGRNNETLSVDTVCLNTEAPNSDPKTCYSDSLTPHTSVSDLEGSKDSSLQNVMFRKPFKCNPDNGSSSSLPDKTTHFTSSYTSHNCNNDSPAAKRKLLSLDAHSPSKLLKH